MPDIYCILRETASPCLRLFFNAQDLHALFCDKKSTVTKKTADVLLPSFEEGSVYHIRVYDQDTSVNSAIDSIKRVTRYRLKQIWDRE